jgi:hypothetical protein
MKGGQRLTVSSSPWTTALKAWAGIAFSQSGRPWAAGIGGGSSPCSSGGQRKVRVSGGSGSGIGAP